MTTRFKRAAVLAAALGLAGAGLAVQAVRAQSPAMPTVAPGVHVAAQVESGTYDLDPTHSQVMWRVNHLGFNDYFGLVGGETGKLVLDTRNMAGTRVEASVPLAHVVTVDPKLTAHLLRPGADGAKPDFFGPTPADAHFVSTRVVKTGAATARITGNLTMNGVTRPIVLLAEFVGTGPNPFIKGRDVGFHAVSTLRRSEFGLGFFVPLVSDEVRFELSINFHKP